MSILLAPFASTRGFISPYPANSCLFFAGVCTAFRLNGVEGRRPFTHCLSKCHLSTGSVNSTTVDTVAVGTGIPNRSVVSLWPGCTRSTLSGLHTLSFSRLACNLFPVTSSKKGATAAYETICLWIVPIPPPLSHIPNNPCLRSPLGLSLSF